MPEGMQERALNLLVDMYEKSPAFRGEAKVHRNFSISPQRVWPAYLDDFTPVDQRDRFEWQMEQLERDGLVTLRWDRPPRHELKMIQAREEAWTEIYRRLNRKDARARKAEEIAYYEHAGKTEATRCFARREAERLRNQQKARYELEKAQILIRLVDRIAENQQFLLERELSMDFFRDSKAFEKTWRKPVVEMLTQFGKQEYPLDQAENPDSERERQAIVLAAHGIEPNPSYIFLKGDMTLRFQDGTCTVIPWDVSFALQTTDLEKLVSVHTDAAFVMTVENLTAYHRVREPEGICIFLSGFHRVGMEKLMRMIAGARPDLSWRHFGDLDPAGIQILKRLRQGTGLNIIPWHMGVEDLETWQAWGKPLEAHDTARLKNLRKDTEWAEVAVWMENHHLKLEQEWIAWNLYADSLSKYEKNLSSTSENVPRFSKHKR